MPRAVWNDTVLADSDATVVIEGNHYFPPESVRWEHLVDSPTRTRCFWKGVASYYAVSALGGTKRDAAWTYADPMPAAESIREHVAFSRGVQVVGDDGRPVAGLLRRALARLGLAV